MPKHQSGATTTVPRSSPASICTGKHAVVTGASSGIGTETARALASAGADVTLAVRNVQAGTEVANPDRRKPCRQAPGGIDVAPLDLAEPSGCAVSCRPGPQPLDILVNNAGLMAPPELTRTADGM